MAIRVRLRLESLKGSSPSTVVEATALVNSGYETDSEECSLPSSAAQALGLWPTLPVDSTEYKVRGYTGEGNVHLVSECLRVSVLVEDRQGPVAVTSVIISPFDDEILISDFLGGSLGINMVDTRAGLWRFRDDPPETLRPSEQPQIW